MSLNKYPVGDMEDTMQLPSQRLLNAVELTPEIIISESFS